MAPQKEITVEIVDSKRDLGLCRQATLNAASEAGFDSDSSMDVASAVFEACVNADTHNHREKQPAILHISIFDDRLVAVVENRGEGFDCPDLTPIPPAAVHRGRGIPLMREFMDTVTFESDNGCKVTLVKYLPGCKP